MIQEILLKCAILNSIVKIILKNPFKTIFCTFFSIVISYQVQFWTIGMKNIVLLKQED